MWLVRQQHCEAHGVTWGKRIGITVDTSMLRLGTSKVACAMAAGVL